MNKDFLKDSFYLHSDSKNKLKDADRQMDIVDWLKVNEQFEKICHRIVNNPKKDER